MIKESIAIRRILSDPSLIGSEIVVRGWVRSLRKSKNFSFMVLNDGSCQNSLQAVLPAEMEGYSEATKAITGYCVGVRGRLVESTGGGQSVELQAQSVEVFGAADATYPLQKKATSLEFLREVAHLRPRTNTFGAVFRLRHHLSVATHKFFDERDFYYIHTPIVTASDCEGAGQMFRVSTLDPSNPPRTPQGAINYQNDFYGRPTYLTVSGQLEGECMALGLGKVYTFGPTFRAENSNTPRHLSEFWMIEPEMAFFDLYDNAALAADYIKYLIQYALDKGRSELEFLQSQNQEKSFLPMLEKVATSDFETITYTEAVAILERAQSSEKFEFPVHWGTDLQTEHERYLTEKHLQRPVIVVDYPKEIKSFYMKLNSDGKTVRAMDVLVPGVGEIIGGSQREEDYSKLTCRIQELGLSEKDYWWYLDLRKFGSAPHSGFGLGLERAVMYISGMSNIRDVIPFPRFPKSAEF